MTDPKKPVNAIGMEESPTVYFRYIDTVMMMMMMMMMMKNTFRIYFEFSKKFQVTCRTWKFTISNVKW